MVNVKKTAMKKAPILVLFIKPRFARVANTIFALGGDALEVLATQVGSKTWPLLLGIYDFSWDSADYLKTGKHS